jgi:hypothetical protein
MQNSAYGAQGIIEGEEAEDQSDRVKTGDFDGNKNLKRM